MDFSISVSLIWRWQKLDQSVWNRARKPKKSGWSCREQQNNIKAPNFAAKRYRRQIIHSSPSHSTHLVRGSRGESIRALPRYFNGLEAAAAALRKKSSSAVNKTKSPTALHISPRASVSCYFRTVPVPPLGDENERNAVSLPNQEGMKC